MLINDFEKLSLRKFKIKSILPDATILILGKRRSGKSFLVLDLAFAIARGTEWQGFNVSPGRVVYIAAEAGAEVRKRLLAYAVYNEIDLDDVLLDIIPAAPDFISKDDVVDIGNAIGQASLIIVDTLACVAAGADENSSTDMGKVIGNCKLLHKLTGAVVMLVHHSGKDVTKGARGWSGIRAAVDAEMELKSVERGFEMRVTKLKEGEIGGHYCFNILQVILGEDDDGDLITSCVVIRHDAQRVFGHQPKGKWRKIIIDTIEKLPKEQDKIHKNELIELIINHDVTPATEGKRDQRKSSISRALFGLVEGGYYKESDGFILLLQQETSPES